MLRYFAGGFILGPLLIISLGYFISNPDVLLWAALLCAAPFSIALVLGIGDSLRRRRLGKAQARHDAGDAVLPQVLDDASSFAAIGQNDGSRPLTPEDVRLRRDYRGWCFASPRQWPMPRGSSPD